MRCHNCGKKIDDNAKFCPYCGQTIENLPMVSPPPPDGYMYGDFQSIGRASDNDIILNYPTISNHHSRIKQIDDDSYYIEYLDSLNGTLVNGQQIKSAYISLTDKIQFGTRYTFNLYRLARQESIGQKSIQITTRTTIGRASDNNLVLEHPTISLYHSIIELKNNNYIIRDLGSTNGTYVNGTQVKECIITPEDRISIGSYFLKFLPDGNIEVNNLRDGIRLVAKNLNKVVGDGKKILDDVSFTIEPGEFVGLIGPSGSGKTTLLNLLNGYDYPRKIDGKLGEVLLVVNGEAYNLHSDYDFFKSQIGYAPQGDVIHRELRVYESLVYSARLRGVDDKEIEKTLSEVMLELGLDDSLKNVIIGDELKKGISGGQRRRVNLAQELITSPNLLFLDEPTSGLDPNTDKEVMHILRKLADKGRTIVLTTHSITRENFELLDHLIILCNGKLVYYGPANEAVEYFGVDEPADIYRILDERKDSEHRTPDNWQETYQETEYYNNYVKKRDSDKLKENKTTGKKQKSDSIFRQGFILIERYFHIKANDLANLGILAIQAPIIALCILLLFNNIASTEIIGYTTILFMLGVSSLWFGCSNSAREIVTERAIYRRERKIMLQLIPYLSSKLAILSLLCIFQCVILLGITYIGIKDFYGNFGEILITLILTSWAGLSLGILISVMSPSPEAAMATLPVILIPQILFGGTMRYLNKMSFISKAISNIMISRWSLEALLSSADMNITPDTIPPIIPPKEGFASPEIAQAFQDSTEYFAAHIGMKPNRLYNNWLILGIFIIVFIILSLIFLKQKDKETL